MLCYTRGAKQFTAHFIIFIREREDSASPWRLGLAVSKKIGSAVKRNRIKRVVREAVRLNQFFLQAGHDYVLVPKRNFSHQKHSLAGLEAELLPFFKAWPGKVLRNRP